MKKSIENILVLVCICAVVSVLLAVTNAVTAPFIAENEEKKANAPLPSLTAWHHSKETVHSS